LSFSELPDLFVLTELIDSNKNQVGAVKAVETDHFPSLHFAMLSTFCGPRFLIAERAVGYRLAYD
jgi:hypothetical protein